MLPSGWLYFRLNVSRGARALKIPLTSQLLERDALMPDNRSHADGARVLADLNALRGIGTYKTGVHKPTFSEPHMRSLEWLAQRLPEAGLTAEIDGIGNVLGTSAKSGTETVGGLASRKPELCGLARWAAWRRLCARSRPRDQSRSERERRGRSRVMVRRGRTFRKFPRQPVLCRRRHRSRYRRRARPQQRPNHA